MPIATITIDRAQRDGLYEVVRNHLGSVGDLFDALERDKDFAAAARLGLGFSEDIQLLEDIGWGEEEARDFFELTMATHDLTELLRRLRGEAGLVLEGGEERTEDAMTTRRFRDGYDACEQVLVDLDRGAGEKS